MMKLPSKSSKDPYERSLAEFARRMKAIYNGKQTGKQTGKLTKEHIRVLSNIPGWSWKMESKSIPCDIEYERCAYFKEEWIEKWGKFPSKYAKTKHERKWAAWVEQKQNELVIPENQKLILNSIPNWTQF